MSDVSSGKNNNMYLFGALAGVAYCAIKMHPNRKTSAKSQLGETSSFNETFKTYKNIKRQECNKKFERISSGVFFYSGCKY